MVKQGETKRHSIPLATPPFFLNDKTNTDRDFASSFQGVIELLQGRKNIVVLLGAGISVSCGIPDFRSSSGLYATLDTEELNLSCPEDLFDKEFFLQDPSPFYKFARTLYFPLGGDKRVEPSDSHKLLAVLEQNRMLLRVYSQNIDGLETVAGVSSKKIVFAHGNLLQASCLKCKRKVSSDTILPDIVRGTVPRCQAETKQAKRRNSNTSVDSGCTTRSTRSGSKGPSQRTRKRQRLSYQDQCGGILKPTVTFFGETLSDTVTRTLEADRKKVDALVVIGTSLSVAPISKVIDFFPKEVPRILINRTVVHPPNSISKGLGGAIEDGGGPEFRDKYVFDAYLLGFCDDITRALAKQLFKNTSKTSQSDSKLQTEEKLQAGRLLSAVLESDGDDDTSSEWSNESVPADRVLLFPGALATNLEGNVEIEETEYEETAQCDSCSELITGDIRKCHNCFDFDLCKNW
ncbi:MAG: hypothetical protein SGBAC_001938 [Bacillariaceae sp.]